MADSGVETVHVPDGPLSAARLPRFGRFQALAELGAGAMGTVYRAHDDVLGRDVAIKVLQGSDGSLRERFLREAKAIGKVTHTNILAVYDAAIDHEVPYLVMELADGSLRDRLTSGPLPADVVRQIGIQIAHGLAAAHAANILHRDVKPGNILVAPTGVYKLADFGIARMPDSTLTASGQFLGSPSYAAPESIRAGAFSTAADVYGLGATLYEALTGTPPHGFEHASIMRKLDVDAPPLPASVPAAIAGAVMAALAREPSQRPTADALAQMLAAVDARSVERVHVEPAPRDAAQPIAKPSGASGTLIVVAIAAAAIATVVVIAAIMEFMAAAPEIEQAITGRQVEARPTPDPEPTDPPVVSNAGPSAPAGCTQFESQHGTATWTGCPDEAVRKIVCEPFMDKLSCDCFEDGAKRWFFNTDTMPDFSTAAKAARVARNCKMGFGH